MSLVSLKCPRCGGDIQLDRARGEGFCMYCGCKCILKQDVNKTETNNYTVTKTETNNITNIDKQINYNYGASEFEKEKKQCKVLLMLMHNLDLSNLEERALRVLDLNPDNSLALMIYNCDFSAIVSSQTDLVFLKYNEEPLLKYIKENKGYIDAETTVLFAKMLMFRPIEQKLTPQIMEAIFANLDSIGLSPFEKAQAYESMIKNLCDNDYLSSLKTLKSLSGGLMVASLLAGDNYQASQARSIRNEAKMYSQTIFQLRSTLASIIVKHLKVANIGANNKTNLLNIIYRSGLATGAATTQQSSATSTATSSTTASSPSSNKSGVLKALMWVAIIVAIIFVVLLIYTSSMGYFAPLIISIIAAIIFGVLAYKQSNK